MKYLNIFKDLWSTALADLNKLFSVANKCKSVSK